MSRNTEKMMRTILIIAGRYLPGFRDGGPVRSILNLTEWLGDEYDIRILCHDRDHGDTEPYPGIKYNEYNRVGKAKVWYVKDYTPDIIVKLSADAHVVYVAGLYDDYARLAMRLAKAGKIKSPLYVAPMGSFSPEAFRIKGLKKRLFIMYMKLTGAFRKVVWSVTSGREKEELTAVIGAGADCIIATDLPRRGLVSHKGIKEAGKLRLVFVSRISPKKNLMALYDILSLTRKDADIKLDVYGTCEDAAYFDACRSRLDQLERSHPHFCWEYKGEAESEKVPEIFAEYDAFLFPTLGENYGHVIAESLSSGCVPVISDTTPWLDLEKEGCGYVCRLSDMSAFARSVEALAAMSEEEHKLMRDKCVVYITSLNEKSVANTGYRAIFGS